MHRNFGGTLSLLKQTQYFMDPKERRFLEGQGSIYIYMELPMPITHIK